MSSILSNLLRADEYSSYNLFSGTCYPSLLWLLSTALFLQSDALPLSQKHRLFSGKCFPPFDDDIDISRVKLHAIGVSAVLFACHDCCTRASEKVEDSIAALCVILDLVVKQGNGFHRRVFLVLRRSVKFENRCLLSVGCPKMTCAAFPSVQTRLVLPLVVLPPHHHRVFDPYKALPNTQHCITARTAKIVPLTVGVPNIKRRSRLHHRRGIGECVCEESAKRGIFHVIVFNLSGGALIVHIVRRVGEKQIHLCPPR